MILSGFGDCLSGRCRGILSNPTSNCQIESIGSSLIVGNVGFHEGGESPCKDSVE